jgi:WD40 repeat protein
MRYFQFLSFAVVLVWLVGGAPAAPVPKDTKTPISVTNADQLRSIKDAPRSVYHITQGPKRGELIIFDHLNSVEIVDEATLRTISAVSTDQHPMDFAHSPDGKLRMWHARKQTTYTVENTVSGKKFEIEIGPFAGSATFSPDGKLLAIGRSEWNQNAPGGPRSEMLLFDASGKHLRTLEKTAPGGLTPVFSPDGKIIAVGNRNDVTQLFEVATGKRLHTLEKTMTQQIAFSPDGKILAAGYVDGTLGLWDVGTGKLLHSVRSTCAEVYSVAWSPRGDVLASSGRNGKIVLWDPTKMKALVELDAPDWVIQVRFVADGTRLLSAGGSDYGRAHKKMVLWALPATTER